LGDEMDAMTNDESTVVGSFPTGRSHNSVQV